LQPPTEIPSIQPETPKKSTFWRDVWEIVQTLLLALILYFAIDAVFARVRVDNISMETTLMPGDLLVINKLAYKLGTYHTGEVIVFHDPLNVKEDFIKRIIGTPGATVSVHNGQVTVNGVVLKENYINAIPNYEGDWVVPNDALFVLGDNRNESSDSHIWGFVPLYDVVGKALFVYWPVNLIKGLGNPYK
jgi:signal peptidase I